jgi:hypothetical protein
LLITSASAHSLSLGSLRCLLTIQVDPSSHYQSFLSHPFSLLRNQKSIRSHQAFLLPRVLLPRESHFQEPNSHLSAHPFSSAPTSPRLLWLLQKVSLPPSLRFQRIYVGLIEGSDLSLLRAPSPRLISSQTVQLSLATLFRTMDWRQSLPVRFLAMILTRPSRSTVR